MSDKKTTYKFIIPCENDITSKDDPRSYEQCFLYDTSRISDSAYQHLMCTEALAYVGNDNDKFDVIEMLATRCPDCEGDTEKAKKLYEETAAIDINCGSLSRFYGFPY